MVRGRKNRSPEPDEADEADYIDDDVDADEFRYGRTAFQRIVLSLGVLIVLGCFATVAGITYEAYKIDQIEKRDVALAAASDDEPQNWLIVGSDSRDAIAKNDPNAAVFTGGGEATGGQRSDTIMIIRLDPKGEQLEILSLQRDLWVPIAGTGGDERINSAYSYSNGAQRLIDTIKQPPFNIEINHFAEINFASFEGIVEAVDGLPMYFDKPMHDVNSGLEIAKPGCITLDGYQALAFARSRHLQYSDGLHWIDDPSGDLGRISRQQYFMKKMFDRAASRYKNPVTLNQLVDVARQYVALDKNLDITKVLAMADRFATFRGDSIRSYSLPVSPFTTPGGAAVLRLDPVGSQPILNKFRGIPDGDEAPENVKFSIENGSGTAGQAAEVQRAFQAIGYGASGAKDHGSLTEKTEVLYAPGSVRTADQVSRHLTNGADLIPDPTLAEGKVVLVTGKDFTTVMRRPRDPSATPPTEPPLNSITTTTPLPGKATTTSTTPTTSGKPSKSTTTSTAPPTLNNDGTAHVGVVPGEPPEGVECK